MTNTVDATIKISWYDERKGEWGTAVIDQPSRVNVEHSNGSIITLSAGSSGIEVVAPYGGLAACPIGTKDAYSALLLLKGNMKS